MNNLRGIVTNRIVRIKSLKSVSFNHVVIPRLSVFVIVKDVVHEF